MLVMAMVVETGVILSPGNSKPPGIQFPIGRNRRSTMTAKSSGSRTLRIELPQGKGRGGAEWIQQIPLSPRSGSETVAKDFVIPVAWSTLLIEGYILTAAKLETTQGESIGFGQALIRLGCLGCLQVFRYQMED